MLAFAIDRGDRFRKGHAALLSDLFQTVPELVFKADARLVACNVNRALRNQTLHGFSPQMSHAVLYDRVQASWQTNRIVWTCCHNNTVNGECLDYYWASPAGARGRPVAAREPLDIPFQPGALLNCRMAHAIAPGR